MNQGDAADRAVGAESGSSVKLPLLAQVCCPHCWHQFPPEETLWISSDAESLRGDPKLDDFAPLRFAAERFDVQGHALDARGQRAQGLACPNCHLEVPRAFFEYKPYFVSIVGAPGSGKSFFLPAMTWNLRSLLPGRFKANFQDADSRFNIRLHDYEKSLFLNDNRDTPVTLEKTQEEAGANLYDDVKLGGDTVSFPRPFVFRMEPTIDWGAGGGAVALARALCLYDNAGESFLAAAAPRSSRLTNHLEHCDTTLFMFDPTQHPRFREAAAGKSRDPQFSRPLANVVLQNTILDNVATRMRKLRGMSLRERFTGSLVLVLTKFDAWAGLLPRYRDFLASDFLPAGGPSGTAVLRLDLVKALSAGVRGLLEELAPEIVAAAEAFSADVTYIPCSATGCNVQVLESNAGAAGDGRSTAYGVRPRDMQPKWCELPILTSFAKTKPRLIPSAVASAAKPKPSTA